MTSAAYPDRAPSAPAAPASAAAPATAAVPDVPDVPDAPGGDRRPAGAWAGPVDRLRLGALPREAVNLNVTGRRLVGPVQGFGRLWQKTYQLRIDAVDPETVVATWKAEFGSFWPTGNRFYGPLTGIAPGEVALLNLAVPGGQLLSTGIMVIYADAESFTFMTPEGHMFAAWITFSAERVGTAAVVRIQVLLRANDPFYEVMMAAGGHRKENAFWLATLRNLGARFGSGDEPTMEQVCVDRRRQWSRARNLRHNAALRSVLWSVGHPIRTVRRLVHG
jgi:hypothetical protein